MTTRFASPVSHASQHCTHRSHTRARIVVRIESSVQSTQRVGNLFAHVTQQSHFHVSVLVRVVHHALLLRDDQTTLSVPTMHTNKALESVNRQTTNTFALPTSFISVKTKCHKRNHHTLVHLASSSSFHQENSETVRSVSDSLRAICRRSARDQTQHDHAQHSGTHHPHVAAIISNDSHLCTPIQNTPHMRAATHVIAAWEQSVQILRRRVTARITRQNAMLNDPHQHTPPTTQHHLKY
jgi:hypothetical protein